MVIHHRKAGADPTVHLLTATDYLGGIDTSMFTWSACICPSRILPSFWRVRLCKHLPKVFAQLPIQNLAFGSLNWAAHVQGVSLFFWNCQTFRSPPAEPEVYLNDIMYVNDNSEIVCNASLPNILVRLLWFQPVKRLEALFLIGNS